MEARNDTLSTLQITSSVRYPPMPRLRALQKILDETSLRANPAAIESPITIVDGVLQEISI